MKSFKISLHGSLLMDSHYCVDRFLLNSSNKCIRRYRSPGGIANLVNAFSDVCENAEISIDAAVGDDENGKYLKRWFKTFNKLSTKVRIDSDIKVVKQKTSEATIISEMLNKRRSSIVSWGACTKIKELKTCQADWSHVLYIDKLESITQNSMKEISRNSITSIDLCTTDFDNSTRERIHDLLPYVDFVFSSREEAMHLANKSKYSEAVKYLGNLSRLCAVVHSPKECSFYNKVEQEFESVVVPRVIKDPINVNGAGDTFTASFINAYLSGLSVKESIVNSHNNTFKILSKRIQNEKI
jgi:sugar/nucleoside kinase (ribokinase family)